MKKLYSISLILMIFWVVCSPVMAKDKYAPNQIIVEFKPDIAELPFGSYSVDPAKMSISSGSIKALNDKFKAKKIEKLFKDVKTKPSSSYVIMDNNRKVKIPDLSNFYIIHFPDGLNVEEVMATYKKDPNIISASLNHEKEAFMVPNDPKYGNFPTYFNQWGLFKINMEKAWNITNGSEDQIVAVIDTGINYNHEDLQGRVIKGYDYVNGDMDPMDDNGHGTHVAGIIGATGDNTKGIAGINWKCKLLALKILNSQGRGYTGSSANAIIYAADNGARIINMSYGSFYNDPFEEAAVSYAYAKGCVLVAAAGNYTSGTPMYPAAFDHVIAVASTDIYDRMSSYSNFGGWIDISAPGGDTSFDPKTRILSSFYDNNSNYVWMMGTSMAAPHVSGVASLVLAMDPGASPDKVEEILKNSADDITLENPEYGVYLGAGRLNAYRASNIYTTFSSIKDGSNAYGDIQIYGTASHEAFKYYTLKWAPGINPAEESYSSDGITLVNEGITPVKDDLLGTWSARDKFGTYTLKISINDWPTLESTVVLKVGDYSTLGKSESGPNPFNPSTGETTKIKYTLSRNMSVRLDIFDITATIIWSKTYPAGSDGGKAGTNIIEWDGSSKFGGLAANGAYIYNLSSSGQQIGKGKLIVLK